MKYSFIYKYFLLFFLSSCYDEKAETIRNEEGIYISLPYQRLAKLTDDNSKLAILGMANFAKYERGAILSGKNDGKITLKMVDVDSGEELWEWHDPINYPNFDITNNYTFDRYLIWDEGRELFCVDMTNGETVWKARYGNDDSPLIWATNGLGTDVYVLTNYPYTPSKDNPSNVRIYKASVQQGPNLEEVARLPLGHVSNIDHISAYSGKIAIIPKQDTLIFCDSNYSLNEEWAGQSYISLYNYSKNQWVYEKIELGGIDSHSVDKPKYHNGIVYLTMSPYIVAVDLRTGEEVWRWHQPNAGHGTSGCILVPEKDLIIFNAETSSTTLYALNLANGNQRWSAPSSGTSSRLQYMNGVVYWVGGGDGRLHAVDVDSGKTLWKIKSPDEKHNSRAFFTRYCAAFPGIDGEPGKIVVSSGLHAFAYEEAERE